MKAETLLFLFFLVAPLITSCGGVPLNQAESVPIIPVELFSQGDGVVPWRAPLQVRDTRLQMLQFDAAGNRELRSYDESIFPVDLLIVYPQENQSAIVFLRRSPHGGCLLLWNQVDSRFDDPCFGSKFDLAGNYLFGPSPRDMDQLPASVRDGMIWVTPEILYGESHP